MIERARRERRAYHRFVEGTRIPRVLIVEDDETVRGFLAKAIESQGCEWVGAATGETALEAINTPPGVSAMLIDGILPDMHGFRLAQRIIEEPAGRLVGICFVTGALREGHRVQAGVGALSKPVRLAELRGVVDEMVAWRAAGGSAAEARREALGRIEQVFLVGP